MKKIGKKSKGSELFTVIEPGLPSNQLSEAEKDLVLGGGSCGAESCAGNAGCIINACGGQTCGGAGCGFNLCGADACAGNACTIDLCPADACVGDLAMVDSGSESDSYGYPGGSDDGYGLA